MNSQRDKNLILLGLLAVIAVSPVQALNDGELQRAILDSKALGNMGASVQVRGTQAYVSTYQDNGDNINSCKAKAVLVAKCLLDKVPNLASVHCNFCMQSDARRLIAVDVPEALIKSFVAGRTPMPKLLASLTAQNHMNAVDTIRDIDLVITGEVHLDERKRQAYYINGLYRNGTDVKEIVREFNLEQVAINSNDAEAYNSHFNNCSQLIEAADSAANERARHSSNNSDSPVKPGAFQGERTALWAQLAQLRKTQGQDKSFLELQERFDTIERNVTATSQTNIKYMIKSLDTKIAIFRQTHH